MKKLIAILALVAAIAAGAYFFTHRGADGNPAADPKAEAEKIKSLGYAH